MEKMQVMCGREEKILVLVRLRPLNKKEVEANEVADWECINETTILYRNSLREGSLFPSAYTFDRVFHGECSTGQVYEEGAKQIALSVVSGINSSIFAYGQTSSGKTYTMTGIIEQTVTDIFDYIHNHQERAFVLKFSAIEIYNEAIRDLLSSENTSLRLRDDPARGTIVEKVTEETLRDWNHFSELVSICEAHRQIGETSLNERSSRSHQILKLTVESSAHEFLGKDNNSATLAASVHFIDLAGSERVSQALSAGTRLKEGCHINRSLLTLGTVVRKLSKGRNGHINYRDSKLTRILQPALGGNARTAIICTLSPAQSHVEQTRNTLLFACCAKEVTTKAQVNVVMSDKALVKHLQKEVARLENELKCPAPASLNCDYAALIRKKDIQIEKMEKEIRELTKQRDLAQSRVEDLLCLVGDGDTRKPVKNGHLPLWQAEEPWEDNCSESESSFMVNSFGQNARMKRFNGTYENGVTEDNDATTRDGEDDPDEYCKDVQCIEMGESTEENTMEYGVNGDVATQTVISAELNEHGEGSEVQNLSNYEVLEQRLNDVQGTIDSLGSHPDEPSAESMGAENISSSRNFRFSRSTSHRGNALNGSASLGFETENSEATPPSEFKKGFSGRPEGVKRRFLPLNFGEGTPRLSRNNSQSSIGAASIAPSIGLTGYEDITSVQTFAAGMKEMANAYEKQLAEKDSSAKNVKDVALDPMQEAFVGSADWPMEFGRLQKTIIGLWQACNMPLIHRTYFFLLFRGDPADSIYMEVEFRRLTFMKEMFADEGQAMQDGRTITLATSFKALHRERQKLCRLMRRRLSEEERERLFEKWGIGLGTKRRRHQLASRVWSEEDMDHVVESASIVAKLVRFTDQGQALKGTLGLSFSTPPSQRRTFSWKNSMASLM